MTRPLSSPFVVAALAVAFVPSILRSQSAVSAASETERAAPAETSLAPLIEPDLVARIRTEGLERSQVMAHLDHLTNTIGHRLTGSARFTLACEWARSQFEQMGLPAELERWDTWPVGWDREQWMGRLIAPEAMELQVACEAWTAGTPGRVTAPLIVEPTTDEEFAAVESMLRGAWLLEFVEPAGTEGDGRRRRARPTLPALEQFLAEQSIAGWVKTSRGDANYPNRIRVFGANRPRDANSIPRTPTAVVRADQFQRLYELASAAAPGGCIVEFDLRNRWTLEPVDLHNVIAELRGTEKPDEIVVVCGHLDSWHQATGTTDNGTGTSTTLEAARILTAVGAKPKRTIRFCLWGGEEQGLLGSRAHVQQRRAEMGNVQIVFNHDTGTNWAQSLTVNQAIVEPLQRVFAPVMEMTPPADASFDGPIFEVEGRERIGGGGGSDHASFLAARVPAFSWGLKGRVDYFGYTWHSQWDTFDVAVPAYQRHTATVIALAALGAANLEEKLSNEGIDVRQSSPLPITEILGQQLGAKFGGAGDLVVTSITEGGRAAKIGLQDGDKIVKLAGTEMKDASSFRLALRAISRRPAPRDGVDGPEAEEPKVTLTVLRNGADVDLEVSPSDLRTQRTRGTR